MSEYLSKKAVLEYTKQNAAIFFDLESYHDFRNAVLFGAFDADTSEIQRLRAALEMAQSELRWGDPTNAIERVERIIDEALSTATEPTAERVRNDGFLGEKINEKCPKCGADLLGNKVGDKWCSMAGCDYVINAPEGDGNDA